MSFSIQRPGEGQPQPPKPQRHRRGKGGVEDLKEIMATRKEDLLKQEKDNTSFIQVAAKTADSALAHYQEAVSVWNATQKILQSSQVEQDTKLQKSIMESARNVLHAFSSIPEEARQKVEEQQRQIEEGMKSHFSEILAESSQMKEKGEKAKAAMCQQLKESQKELQAQKLVDTPLSDDDISDVVKYVAENRETMVKIVKKSGKEGLFFRSWDEAATGIPIPPRTLFVTKEGKVILCFKKHRIIKDKLLGKGAYKAASVGLDIDNGTPIAVLTSRLNESTEKDYRREIAILKELQDIPLVMRIFVNVEYTHKGVEKGTLFVEYCEGGDLRKALAKQTLSPEQKQQIGRQILQTLCELKEREVVWVDLKPENLLLKEGSIKFADAGKAFKAADAKTMESIGGTAQYMAPEVLQLLAGEETEGTNISEKVDVWAAGCIFCELFKGNLPPWTQREGGTLDINLAPTILPKLNNKEYMDKTFKEMLPEHKTAGTIDNLIWQMFVGNPAERTSPKEALEIYNQIFPPKS